MKYNNLNNVPLVQVQVIKKDKGKYLASECFTVYGVDYDEAVEKIKFFFEKFVEDKEVTIQINKKGGVSNGG